MVMIKPIALPLAHARVVNIMDIEGMDKQRGGVLLNWKGLGRILWHGKNGNATYISWNITEKFWSLMISTNIVHCDKSDKDIEY